MSRGKRFYGCLIISILCILWAACMGVSASTTVQYQLSGKTKTYSGKLFKLYYNDTAISTKTNVPGIRVDGCYMVPVKTFLAQNGPKISYTYSKGKMTLVYNGTTVKFTVGSKYMYVGSKKVTDDIETIKATVNGVTRVYVPAKALKQAYGFSYTYNYSKGTIKMGDPSVTAAASSSSTSTSSTSVGNITAKSLKAKTVKEFISIMGPICQKNYKKTGILASVTLAQAINESGWAKSSLAQKSNNLFGMKISLSGNNWSGSVWDGKSYVKVATKEEVNGKKITIYAKFRKYPSVQKSVTDHSAYLKNAMNGSKKRYAGITSTKSYTKQLSIIKNGGYCTWSGYYSELKSLIKRYNLTQYDKK